MWARKRLDVAWSDLAFGAAHCFAPADRDQLQQHLESQWSLHDDALVCLSVRSGFDLLLGALELPPESEVLVSALTIQDMVRIIDEHGLVPVPVDLDATSMSPDLETLRRAVTPATKAIVVAHLFGGRFGLEPVLETAKEHGLVVIEDCAQAFAGPDYRGHPEADAAMFSFGPIKTATALGGALVRVRDPAVLARMRQRQAAYPVQSRWAYLRRVLKYAALKGFSSRPAFALLVRLCRLAGQDHDRLVNGAVRGFAGERFFDRIRHQPSAPLLSLLDRRLGNFDAATLARRAAAGRALLELLGDAAFCPGASVSPHHYWVFPLLADEPDRAIMALRQEGFDATQGQSLAVVDPPAGRPGLDPYHTRRTVAHTVYLPCYPEMPLPAIRRMAEVLADHAAPRRESILPLEAAAATNGSPGVPCMTTSRWNGSSISAMPRRT